MPKSQSQKFVRESEQVRKFLLARQTPFLDLKPGNDPPDVLVLCDAGMAIHIEVSEYHPEDDRVGAEKRWMLFSKEYLQIAKSSDLKGVMCHIGFADGQLHISRDHKALAKQLIDCIQCLIAKRFLELGRLELEFVDDLAFGVEEFDGRHLSLSSRQWPILRNYLSMVIVECCPIDYVLPCCNYQTETAWCSASADHFMTILQSKEKKIANGVGAGRFSPERSELVLLVMVDTQFDLASMASDCEGLRSELVEKGFDFEKSGFSSIWIMPDRTDGRPWRVHPE
jgi:hypothetical protein